MSGRVFESTPRGSRPVHGVTIYVDVSVPGLWYFFGKATPDVSGHYSVSQLPTGGVDLWAFKEGYGQPCFTSLSLRGDGVLDIELVSVAALSSPDPPSLTTVGSPRLSGVVFETKPEGIRSVDGVALYAEVGDGRFVSTFSDLEGRYLFCRVPDSVTVYATKEGYDNWSARVRVSGDTSLDIDLKQR